MRKGDNSASGLLVESLEGRRMLSGNVAVAFDGTTVTVLGDNKSNQIVITGKNFGYRVIGLAGTTVNGAPFADAITGGAAANMRVSMGNGEDFIRFEKSDGPGIGLLDTSIAMGNGSDSLLFKDFVGVFGNLDLTTGNGGDDVHFDSDTLVTG